MSRADVDSSAKPAHAWVPVLIRDCSVAKSMDEDTWDDNSCTVKPRPNRPSEIAKPTDKMPEGTTISNVEE